MATDRGNSVIVYCSGWKFCLASWLGGFKSWKRLVFGGIVFLGFVLARGAVAAQPILPDACPSPMLPAQPHPMGAFNFDTSSWAVLSLNLPYYEDCVRNNGPGEWLHVMWYGSAYLDNWFPRGHAMSAARVMPGVQTEDVTPGEIRAYDTCIAYGGAGRATRAYLADTHPLSGAAFAGNPNCPAPELPNASPASSPPGVIGKPSSAPTRLSPAIFRLQLFFPTDDAHPAQSMLQVLATDEFLMKGQSEYVSRMEYTVSRVEGAKFGRLDEIQVRLLFPGAAKAAKRFYDQNYPDGIVPPLQVRTAATSRIYGEIFLPIESNEGWSSASAVLQFTDLDLEQLAAVMVPLFIPGH